MVKYATTLADVTAFKKNKNKKTTLNYKVKFYYSIHVSSCLIGMISKQAHHHFVITNEPVNGETCSWVVVQSVQDVWTQFLQVFMKVLALQLYSELHL